MPCLTISILLLQLHICLKLFELLILYMREQKPFQQRIVNLLKQTYREFVFDILGLKQDNNDNNADADTLMKFIMSLRTDAKSKKDFSTSDKIRDELASLGFKIKDEKDGTMTWAKNN